MINALERNINETYTQLDLPIKKTSILLHKENVDAALCQLINSRSLKNPVVMYTKQKALRTNIWYNYKIVPLDIAEEKIKENPSRYGYITKEHLYKVKKGIQQREYEMQNGQIIKDLAYNSSK
ncbi:MAG: hypothetical protein PHE43_01925 [Candidatus Nanoarchaeia archaeon]|nr:hypothetical protein [Candidatus Nanoarchaeia archaeon]